MSVSVDVFELSGSSVSISVTNVASAGVSFGGPSFGGKTQLRVGNNSAQACFIAIGVDAAQAQANCVIPTPGSPQKCHMIAANSIEVFTVPIGWFISAITPTGVTTIYVLPGSGA